MHAFLLDIAILLWRNYWPIILDCLSPLRFLFLFYFILSVNNSFKIFYHLLRCWEVLMHQIMWPSENGLLLQMALKYLFQLFIGRIWSNLMDLIQCYFMDMVHMRWPFYFSICFSVFVSNNSHYELITEKKKKNRYEKEQRLCE